MKASRAARASATAAVICIAAGCAAKPEPPDTSPPTITLSLAAAGCATGALAPEFAMFAGTPEKVRLRNGGARASFDITVADRSGVKSVYLLIPAGALASPPVTKTIPTPSADGGVSEMFEYAFAASDGAAAPEHVISIDLTHSDRNRVFNIRAADALGQETGTQVFVIGEAAVVCG